MSFVQPTTILLLAESLVVPKVSSDAAKALAPHIDVRLREIIQEACKFSRHSKRSTLTTEDINSALRLRNCEPLYGFGGKDPARFVKAAGHPDLFYVEDLEIPVSQVIEAELPKAPVEVGVVPHWLAIEGVQPNTAENAPLERSKLKRPRAEAASRRSTKKKQNTGSGVGQPSSGTEAAAELQAAAVIPPVRQLLSQELQLYFDKVKKLLADTQALQDTAPGGPFSGWQHESHLGDRQAGRAGASVSGRLAEERALLASLANDPGMHPLTVALVELLTEQTRKCMKQLPQLHLLVRMARSMLQNEHMQLETYLHKIVSLLMTCMVTKRLGAAPAENHWALRDSAAGVIAAICDTFGEKYPDLQQRISKQLVNAFTDPSKPLTTHYGAIVGLTKLGHRVVQLLVLPHAQPYVKLLQPAMSPSNSNELQRAEAIQVHGALLRACASCMYASMTNRLSKDFFTHLRPGGELAPSAKLDFQAKQHSLRPAASVSTRGKGALKKVTSARQARQAASRGKKVKEGAGKAEKARPDDKQSNKLDQGPTSTSSGPTHGQGSTGVDENALVDAWREDSHLGKNLVAVHELYGDGMQPYVPWPLLDQAVP